MEAKAKTLPFLTSRARVVSRYGINIDKDDFIERAYYIWRDLGGVATVNKRFTIATPADRVVELPSDCEYIRAVTTDEVMPNTIENTSKGSYRYDSSGVRREVSPDIANLSSKSSVGTSKNYQWGATVDYTIGDGFIELTSATMINRPVTIQYQAIATDADELPLLNDKEVNAIAANMALQEGEKSLFQGKKGSDVLVQYLKMEADRLFQAAKIPEKLTDDGLDKVLDAKTSWNRKVYGHRFNGVQ